MRKKRLNVVLFVFLAFTLLPLLFLSFERIRGRVSLRKYKQYLIAKGEKLSAQDFVSLPTANENGASELLAASKELAEGEILSKHYPPRMQLTPAGHAIVCCREAEWVEDKLTNHWDQLSADLKMNEAPLQRIRAALAKPVLDFQIDLSQGSKMTFSHLVTPKSLTYWFGARIQLALHENRTRDALEDLVAQSRLPRALAQDHIVISELVRIAISAIARTDVWEALQADSWTDPDLAALQKVWQDSNFLSGMANSLEGEVVFGISSFELMRKFNDEAKAALFGLGAFLEESDRPQWEQNIRSFPGGDKVGDFFKEQIYCRIWRFAWLDQSEKRYLEGMQQLLAITRSGMTNKSSAKLDAEISRLDARFVKRSFYDELRFPEPNAVITLARSPKRAMRAETERSTVLCAIALKRYSLRHGKLPEALDSLVPDFLPAIPTDFMDGRPMKYRLTADGSFILYSVGEDGQDDDGDPSLAPGKTTMKNLWDRKDFAWPSPATLEETEAYRKEQREK